jgi:hypothetical protein
VRVIVPDTALEGSVTEVAVNVTVAGDGNCAGGVYVVVAPLAVLAGATVPH